MATVTSTTILTPAESQLLNDNINVKDSAMCAAQILALQARKARADAAYQILMIKVLSSRTPAIPALGVITRQVVNGTDNLIVTAP